MTVLALRPNDVNTIGQVENQGKRKMAVLLENESDFSTLCSRVNAIFPLKCKPWETERMNFSLRSQKCAHQKSGDRDGIMGRGALKSKIVDETTKQIGVHFSL